MASWKLIVGNYGKIKSAEIEVAPLTLFVGDNNSGKSYLMSLLWGIQKYGVEGLVGRKYVEAEETDELIKWLIKQLDISVAKKTHKISLDGIEKFLSDLLNRELKKNKDALIKQIFNSQNVEIEKMEIHFQNLESRYMHLKYDEDTGMYEISGNRDGGFTFGEDIKQMLGKKEGNLDWMLIKELLGIALQINECEYPNYEECVYLPAARTGFMLTKDIINKIGRKNTFNLSNEREAITPFINPINQFLDIMGDLSLEVRGKSEYVKVALDIEEEMTNGVVEVSSMPNKEIQYVPIGFKKGIPLRLSSAVVTELSPLLLVLKHHNVLERFYYEEPEMCLHPQLQSKMGKMIGRMVNSGIGMVITTHSDIMLQHFNNMIKLAKRPDCKEICEQLGYTELDLLKSEQMKIYQLRAKKKGKTEVEELVCGEDGFVVPTFNDALDNIMDEAYEIQG